MIYEAPEQELVVLSASCLPSCLRLEGPHLKSLGFLLQGPLTFHPSTYPVTIDERLQAHPIGTQHPSLQHAELVRTQDICLYLQRLLFHQNQILPCVFVPQTQLLTEISPLSCIRKPSPQSCIGLIFLTGGNLWPRPHCLHQ